MDIYSVFPAGIDARERPCAVQVQVVVRTNKRGIGARSFGKAVLVHRRSDERGTMERGLWQGRVTSRNGDTRLGVPHGYEGRACRPPTSRMGGHMFARLLRRRQLCTLILLLRSMTNLV